MNDVFIIVWLSIIACVYILVVLIKTFIFVPTKVEGKSMLPTLKNNERIIFRRKTIRLNNINRFDVIVFYINKQHPLVKRVIGLPGDHIEYCNHKLYVNGEKYEETHLDTYTKETVTSSPTEDFRLEDYTGSKTVPESKLFVLGDNRMYSIDSRSPKIGTVSINNIVGKAKLTYWPLKRFKWIK
ncbi:signal peptidase I [Priestia sp. D51]